LLGENGTRVDDLKSAVSIDPKLIEADATIVLAMIQQKKYDEAIKEANNLKAKRKDDPLADNLLVRPIWPRGYRTRSRELAKCLGH